MYALRRCRVGSAAGGVDVVSGVGLHCRVLGVRDGAAEKTHKPRRRAHPDAAPLIAARLPVVKR